MALINRLSKRSSGSVAILSLLLLVNGCVSKPSTPVPAPIPEPIIELPEALPQSRLQLVRITAKNPDELQLQFELSIENQDRLPYQLQQLEAFLSFDGIPVASFYLEPALSLPISSIVVQNLAFVVDLREFPGLKMDDLKYQLVVNMALQNSTDAERTSKASLEGTFPRIQKPLFQISAIKIHRAELINTRMNVSLEIENPNGFSLELSALRYELFGEGRYWADGEQKTAFQILPHTKIEVISQITMNFIDMKRALLDQFIKMQDVGYRFKGDVRVLTGINYLPEFIMNFDERGRTPVIE